MKIFRSRYHYLSCDVTQVHQSLVFCLDLTDGSRYIDRKMTIFIFIYCDSHATVAAKAIAKGGMEGSYTVPITIAVEIRFKLRVFFTISKIYTFFILHILSRSSLSHRLTTLLVAATLPDLHYITYRHRLLC